jgi:putative phosphoesterase
MKVLIISDTHKDKNGALEHIIRWAKERGVEAVIHCGDIIIEHVSSELFGGLPVYCALVDGQQEDPIFNEKCPHNWTFTRTGKRIVVLSDGTKVYVGHKKHMEFLRMSEDDFANSLADLRMEHDGLRYVFGGHLHFQTYQHGQLVSFINPGAVEDAIGWGYEFGIVDLDTQEVIFSRVLPIPDKRSDLSVGIITDSLDVSLRDSYYYERLQKEFKSRGVTHIIHCGNISIDDIGRPELTDFDVRFAIRNDQCFEYRKLKESGKIPPNWTVMSETDCNKGTVTVINGYRFFVQLNLGMELGSMNELHMDNAAMKIREDNPEIQFVLCGSMNGPLYFEGRQILVLNPGDTNTSRNFVVICLPRREITFGHVPYDPLPPIPKFITI